MPAGLRFSGVTKTFKAETRDVAALRGVAGEIAPGQITGLVGPDGAGKTTLVRVLAGLLDADGGNVEMAGGEPGQHVRISYMPQKFGLYEDLSVQENMTLYADLQGLAPDLRPERFTMLNRFTNLGPFSDRLAGNLSGGMKQKLGLACTLIVAPDILLLDEPSVGVDPVSRRELWSMVRALQDTGIAVLWSTAYLDEADGCDHVILLHDGQVLDEGAPAAISGHVASRTWRVPVPAGPDAGRKRDLQRAAMTLPGVVDAQIKGRNLRIVMGTDGARPDLALSTLPQLARLMPEPTAPQFEDAYLAAMRKQNLLAASVAFDSAVAVTPEAEAARDVVIETKDLSKRFGAFTAVDRFSFA
ncbi:MAG: ABC transporter ATP-binding protein, partial [Rhodospirillaceae bacterium]|nr:ABC transporter ATP-binding protein [Rhodospirillaceae bacterium]